MPKIFIIGMPGSGKSTIGELLADKLGLPFFDLDEVIVEQEGASVSSIFEVEGEKYFREVESENLKDVTGQNESFVMATGGGSPCYHSGMEWMNEHGTTVFIDVSPEVLIERTSRQKDRPLLKANPRERVNQLYAERIHIYQKAQIHVQAEGLSVEELVEQLREKLDPFF